MRVPAALLLLLPAVLATGCTCVCGTAGRASVYATTAWQPRLSQQWMIGVERMAGDPAPLLPYTNRLILDLAAMPGTQVVSLGTDRNGYLFDAYLGNKLRLAPWLHGGGNCMTATYTEYRAGVQQASYGLVTPPLPAGYESDPACVDRFASDLYASLARQGF